MLPALTLVLGGARSGKSGAAERLVKIEEKPKVYFATAQAFDDEMRGRIAEHQHMRGPDWTTIEVPLDLSNAILGLTDGQVALVDCATLWLTNHMLAEHDLEAETDALFASFRAARAPLVIVSNEVGLGIVPENALARRFRDAQGRLNQRLAARADLVVGVMAGLPFALKGTLPDGFA